MYWYNSEVNLKSKPSFLIILAIFMVGSSKAVDNQAAGRCMVCHKEITPGIYRQWNDSEHAFHNVTCYSCHSADKKDNDAFAHQGFFIATMVTPRDCGNCHVKETEQTSKSHHANAGQILESADAYMAHVTGGHPAAIVGCESCHGGKVKLDPQSGNRLSQESWPNSGIGRLNPDRSKGSCNSCHTRHNFSKSQARQPETCGKCHLGPDHPQKEIFTESKHGNVYYTNKNKMNLEADRWVVGQDYFIAPTCATCHMSANRAKPVTHDVGDRISWTLRPPVSKRQDDWKLRRSNMKEVCSACHGQAFINGHYYQFDALVNLYNVKFATPAGEAMAILNKNKSLEKHAAFSNKIEWTYWELWHHEGRRARHGASMMGPDYTWWHGIYEVAQHFYFKFIPEIREIGDQEAIRYIDDLLKNDPMHQWLTRSTEELKKSIRSGEDQKIYQKLFSADKKP